VNDDSVCVRFVNSSATHVSVNTWVEDTDGNSPLSDTSFVVQVPPGGEAAVCYSNFGYAADQTTPISECVLRTIVVNDDNGSEGVEIYHEVY
jgi:hypothetical protein